jgi:hypothetical protein
MKLKRSASKLSKKVFVFKLLMLTDKTISFNSIEVVGRVWNIKDSIGLTVDLIQIVRLQMVSDRWVNFSKERLAHWF